MPAFSEDVWSAWLSDDEVLYPIFDGQQIAYKRLNVRTGRRTLVKSLGHIFLFEPIVSPDGQRLMCYRYGRAEDRMIHVVNINDVRSWQCTRLGLGDVYWMHNSNCIAELLQENDSWFSSARVTCLTDVANPRRAASPRIAGWSYGRPVVTHQDHVLGYAPPEKTDGRQQIVLFDGLLGGGQPTKTHIARLPEGADLYSIVFSPVGDRILWVFRFDNDSAMRRLLHHVVPAMKGFKRYSLSVWVSAVDGSRMREVGLLNRTDDDVFYTPPPVEWLPGGRGFVFRDGGERWILRL